MATLKQLVDETTSIKNEIVNCKNKIENNLTEKGIEVVPGSKISSLIDKIRELTKLRKIVVGDSVIMYSKEGYFKATGSPDESVIYFSIELFYAGSIRVKLTADGNNKSDSYKIKHRLVTEDGVMKDEKIYTINVNKTLDMKSEFDNIEPYDRIEVLYICPKNWSCQSQNFIISYDLAQ